MRHHYDIFKNLSSMLHESPEFNGVVDVLCNDGRSNAGLVYRLIELVPYEDSEELYKISNSLLLDVKQGEYFVKGLFVGKLHFRSKEHNTLMVYFNKLGIKGKPYTEVVSLNKLCRFNHWNTWHHREYVNMCHNFALALFTVFQDARSQGYFNYKPIPEMCK